MNALADANGDPANSGVSAVLLDNDTETSVEKYALAAKETVDYITREPRMAYFIA